MSHGTLADSVKPSSGEVKRMRPVTYLLFKDNSRGRGVESKKALKTLAYDLSQAQLLADPFPKGEPSIAVPPNEIIQLEEK